MSNRAKQNLIRRSVIFSCFGIEFAVAFLCIISNSMICYGTAAIAGVLLPLYLSSMKL